MRILVFGATGSIGIQTIDVIKKLKHQLVGFSFYKNSKKAAAIIKNTKVKYYYSPINKKLSNVNSFQELISRTKPDLIVNAIIGFAGLDVTLLAIKNKINIALANKESLVVAGRFILSLAKKNNVKIFPIDSEHSAIYQALLGRKEQLKTIYITASGGPFYNKKNTLNVSYKQATKHPK
ncbi:MAG: NAD-dependent epimerase/dehydratase family protein [Mycoplasmoidaceae bacterium]|nr:NAD-dependent epimerase/dehydratase family protein [Mycoplasmoidaceae bacterium]